MILVIHPCIGVDVRRDTRASTLSEVGQVFVGDLLARADLRERASACRRLRRFTQKVMIPASRRIAPIEGVRVETLDRGGVPSSVP